jgi:hypothetical protein
VALLGAFQAEFACRSAPSAQFRVRDLDIAGSKWQISSLIASLAA